jgi:subtilisin family serine protease
MLPVAAAMAHAEGGEKDAFLAAAPLTPEPNFSPSRVIVEWAPRTDGTERNDARESAEVESLRMLGATEFQLVRVAPGQSMQEALDSLRGDPSVLVAERDSLSAPNSIPNDERFGELWGLRNLGGAGIDGFSGAVAEADVNAPAAWDQTVGSPSVVIADIDTGYRFDLLDLGPVAWTNPNETANGLDDDGNGIVDDLHGADFVGPSADASSLPVDGDPTDDNLISGGHGVHTAGTMGAKGNDGFGITGVAQNVRIMPLRVCANSAINANEARCPTSSQIAAINYAGAKGARAANMSLGGTSFSQALVNALAANPQTLFVISAGNDAANNEVTHHYPCDYTPQTQASPSDPGAIDNVICVAATDQADRLASFSDWGATSVDLGAPGTQILSTYPTEESFHDDFEANDFSTVWSKTGTKNFGRAGAGDGPLTSLGMNDSPGEAPLPNTQYDTTTATGVVIPAGSGTCTLSGMRYRKGDTGGTFFYEVQSDGSEAFKNAASTETTGSTMAPFSTVPISGLGGHSVKLRFGYTSGASPVSTNGIWFDDLGITCYKPISAPLSYAYLQGTSMAAPHVTGAAGLLFSVKPAATVKDVRDALLAGVDAIPALAGKTTSGGRLDIAKAIQSLDGVAVDHTAPLKPSLTGTTPESGDNENHPRIIGTAEAGSTVTVFKSLECAGSPIATGTATQLAGAGIEITVPDNSITFLSASTTDAARNKSACSNAISYLEDSPEIAEGSPGGELKISEPSPPVVVTPPPPSPPTCKVPKLTGKTLSQATAALGAAHCSLGKVTKPKARKGTKLGPLIVKSANPAEGSVPPSGKVDVTLGPKPKPKKHHH